VIVVQSQITNSSVKRYIMSRTGCSWWHNNDACFELGHHD